MPSYYVFALNHIDPKTHFKVMRSSNHEGNFLAVLNRQVDVATSDSEMTDKMQETRRRSWPRSASCGLRR